MPRSTQMNLSGWGRFPAHRCEVTRPHSVAALGEAIAESGGASLISRGLGRSYGDAAVNAGGRVVDHTALNRMLEFDAATGVLHAEAGVSLAEIISHFLPRGWFLPTTPGTKFVTLGGATAADVHGKNHHQDGSFGKYVNELELLTADGAIVKCSRDDHPELFAATVGGMGLTGLIVSVKVCLQRVASAWCAVDYRRTRDLDQTLEWLERTNAAYRYSVAWVDALAGGAGLGRSVLMLANDAPVEALPTLARHRPLERPTRRTKNLPIDLPGFALNRLSVRAFNALYYTRNPDRRAIVDYETFFYPLDAIGHWNRIYGKRGFVQYQVLLPEVTARQGLRRILERVVDARQASFLSVLKKSGERGPGMLSFMKPGYTLALDLPNTGKRLHRLARELDRITLEHGGRLYLAKDALTDAETFAAMYDQLDAFRRVKGEVDPHGRFNSSQARRVGIVEGP